MLAVPTAQMISAASQGTAIPAGRSTDWPNNRKGTQMRRFIIAAVTVAFLAVPAVSMADSNGNSANRNPSACGMIHAARADANGNFGWLGPDGGASDHGTTPPGLTYQNNKIASQTC